MPDQHTLIRLPAPDAPDERAAIASALRAVAVAIEAAPLQAAVPQVTVAPPLSLLSRREVAARLSLGLTEVVALIERGALPVVRIGRRVLVRSDALEAYIRGLSEQQAGHR